MTAKSVGFLTLLFAVVVSSCGTRQPEAEFPWLETPKHFPEVNHPADNELTPQRWELGKRLFFETKLSVDGSKSCASCHFPKAAFATNVPTNKGAFGADGTRNSPSLANIGYHPNFTREGGVPTLEMQVLVPIQEENEFHINILAIAETLSQDSTYVEAAYVAYDSEITPFVITRSISAFERTLISGGSLYDKFLAGDSTDLSNSELRGLDVFNSKGCTNCHNDFLLTNFEIINNGLYEEYSDPGLFKLTGNTEDIGKFKVPSLRNVTITHPYMHDGSLATLDDVLDHYVSGGSSHPNKSELIEPITLSEDERSDLKAFFETLLDDSFIEWSTGL